VEFLYTNSAASELFMLFPAWNGTQSIIGSKVIIEAAAAKLMSLISREQQVLIILLLLYYKGRPCIT
jgi:hypothetical protein